MFWGLSNSMGDMIKLRYEVERETFEKAGEASSNTKKMLKKLGIPSQVVRRVAIITYEAEMNIVIHSLGGEIEVDIYPTKIDIIARDQGPGIKDTKRVMQEGYTTAPDHIREMGFGAGMGIPNMKRYSDEFKICSGEEESTEVYMTVYIK